MNGIADHVSGALLAFGSLWHGLYIAAGGESFHAGSRPPNFKLRHYQKAQGLGAKVHKGKTAAGDFGWFSIIEDPTGAQFALWQPKQK